MRCKCRSYIDVATVPEDIRQVAKDPNQRAAWGSEWRDWGPEDIQNLDPKKYDEKAGLHFTYSRRPAGDTQLYLHLSQRDGTETETKVTAWVVEHFGITSLRQWLWYLGPGRLGRKTDLLGALLRLRGLVEPHQMASGAMDLEFKRDDLLTLLNVYSTQVGSYTTMLWQVPALGVAAQAFLMTIVLGSRSGSSDGSKYAASALSIIIAFASWRLMYTQHGRAVNHNELAKRVTRKLFLDDLLDGDFARRAAVPMIGSAENVWAVNHRTYYIWVLCMVLFIVVDLLVIISTAAGFSWFA